MPQVKRALGLALALGLLLTGCSSTPSTTQRTITVFAASSLTRAFTGMAKAFEDDHPGLQVDVSFAGSQALAAQVREGAPADVIATADLATARALSDRLNGAPVVFAHNALALITPTDNRAGVEGLKDLGRSGVRVVLAGPTVPAGRAADAALSKAGVRVTPVSREDSVAGVVTKVRLGEADAGIAYATDLVAAQGIAGVTLAGTSTDLAIAPIRGIDDPDDADAFIGFVRSTTGRRIMESWGFT